MSRRSPATQRYLAAITRIWENVVSRKLHLTGGCGARAAGEAYGDDYELPNRCYNETCAAVAFLFWNHRMFLMTGDAKYMDVFERSLYNGVLSGVSLSGDRFFYPNPLEYDGKAANNHGSRRARPVVRLRLLPAERPAHPRLARRLCLRGAGRQTVREPLRPGRSHRDRRRQQGEASNKPRDIRGMARSRSASNRTAPGQFTLCLRIPGWVAGQTAAQ